MIQHNKAFAIISPTWVHAAYAGVCGSARENPQENDKTYTNI